MIPIVLAILLFQSPAIPKYMGRQVTVTDPGTDADGFFPKGPASICIEGPPQRQCYTMPNNFGRFPSAEPIQVRKDMPALFFSAASGGVSGFEIHFALLQPGPGKNLEDLFFPGISVSNQSQAEFWDDPTISDAKIFVTAEYVWGPEESHYSDHRYIVSAYVLKYSSLTEDRAYYLEDRYMTAHKYDRDGKADDVLASEKPEIINRLRRLTAEPKTR